MAMRKKRGYSILEKEPMPIKPVTAIVTLLLIAISAAHLMRVIFQVNVIVNGMVIPVWVSIFICIITTVLSALLWWENR
jgi:hypothetical protein